MQPQSIPLRVANWVLLGIGLFVLTFSRNHILHALGGGFAALAVTLDRARLQNRQSAAPGALRRGDQSAHAERSGNLNRRSEAMKLTHHKAA